MMEYLVVTGLLSSLIGAAVLFTRLWVKRRARRLLQERLLRWSREVPSTLPKHFLKEDPLAGATAWQRSLISCTGAGRLETLLCQCGMEKALPFCAWLMVLGLVLPAAACFALDLPLYVALPVSLIGPLSLVYTLLAIRRHMRKKFRQQLPEAIDLMVSVLKSGLSVPQAIKSAAEESPSPLGGEFAQVLKRMNLGQALGDALGPSVRRFASYELELIQKAVTIQVEIGGSLAELLEKTNTSLRQRLKLINQVSILTAQSRLTGWIVGLLPIAMAFALNVINPGYLQPLLGTTEGGTLLAVAIALQILGFFVMKRLSSVKV